MHVFPTLESPSTSTLYVAAKSRAILYPSFSAESGTLFQLYVGRFGCRVAASFRTIWLYSFLYPSVFGGLVPLYTEPHNSDSLNNWITIRQFHCVLICLISRWWMSCFISKRLFFFILQNRLTVCQFSSFTLLEAWQFAHGQDCCRRRTLLFTSLFRLTAEWGNKTSSHRKYTEWEDTVFHSSIMHSRSYLVFLWVLQTKLDDYIFRF